MRNSTRGAAVALLFGSCVLANGCAGPTSVLSGAERYEQERRVNASERTALTGSRIKRTCSAADIARNSAVPVHIISREEIDRKGAMSVSEALSNTP